MKQLADALEAHRKRMGQLVLGPIFQGGTGKPLNLDTLVKRAIVPRFRAAPEDRKAE